MVREKHVYFGGVRDCVGSRTSVMEQYQKSNRYAERRPFALSPDPRVLRVDDNYFKDSAMVRSSTVDSNVSYCARDGSALYNRNS